MSFMKGRTVKQTSPWPQLGKGLQIGNSQIFMGDCFDILSKAPECSVHAIVTDPPYGVKEYEFEELEKLKNGKGGMWRIPPSFDGNTRSPLPRFTALNEKERKILSEFFVEWGTLVLRVLRPGGHIFIATNSFIAPLVYASLNTAGLEFRGQIIRLVRTLRGGDRPKNAEEEYPFVMSMPRGCFEPWGLFRKELPDGMRVSDALKEFQTGGLRRLPNGTPFGDVIQSERTPSKEREIAGHPSLKPQSLLRQLVYMSLPLGEGTILDPFMGSGSTIAAAEALELKSIGLERHREYFEMAQKAIPDLKNVKVEEVDKLLGLSRQEELFKVAEEKHYANNGFR